MVEGQGALPRLRHRHRRRGPRRRRHSFGQHDVSRPSPMARMGPIQRGLPSVARANGRHRGHRGCTRLLHRRAAVCRPGVVEAPSRGRGGRRGLGAKRDSEAAGGARVGMRIHQRPGRLLLGGDGLRRRPSTLAGRWRLERQGRGQCAGRLFSLCCRRVAWRRCPIETGSILDNLPRQVRLWRSQGRHRGGKHCPGLEDRRRRGGRHGPLPRHAARRLEHA